MNEKENEDHVKDVGQIYNVKCLLNNGILEEPVFQQFVTGILEE